MAGWYMMQRVLEAVLEKNSKNQHTQLQHTPYEQTPFCDRHHMASKGFCSGLVVDQVTEDDNGLQGIALMIHRRNADRLKKHFLSGGSGSHLGVISVLAKGYIEEKKLTGAVSHLGGAKSCEQTVEFIKKQSDDFQKPVTFISSNNVRDKNGLYLGRHATRFDSLGNGQCSAYDPNSGKYVGQCSVVSKKYMDIIKSYNPDDGAIAGISHKPTF